MIFERTDTRLRESLQSQQTGSSLGEAVVLAGWQLLGEMLRSWQLVEREPAVPADRQLLGRGCSPGRKGGRNAT